MRYTSEEEIPRMTEEIPYDLGYASIDRTRTVDCNGYNVAAIVPRWGPATIRLHLRWLATQLSINPHDHFRWGRYDALCDLLARQEPVPDAGIETLLAGLTGQWRKTN